MPPYHHKAFEGGMTSRDNLHCESGPSHCRAWSFGGNSQKASHCLGFLDKPSVSCGCKSPYRDPAFTTATFNFVFLSSPMSSAAWRSARCKRTTKCGSSELSASAWTKWRDSRGGWAKSDILTMPRISNMSRFDWIPGGRGWTQSSDSSLPNFSFVRSGENSLLNSS